MANTYFCSKFWLKYLNDKYHPFVDYNDKSCNGCNGAHSVNAIRKSINYKEFNKIIFSTLDLLKYFEYMKDNILNVKDIVMNHDKKKINNLNFVLNEPKQFLDVLFLWRELATKYRKIYKNYDIQSNKIKKIYNLKNNIPQLYFNEEENMWTLAKLIIPCKNHHNVCKLISEKKKFSIKKVCVFHYNCNNGYHFIDDSICVDDFLYGNCNCENKNILNEIKKIKSEIKNMNKIIEFNNNEDNGNKLLKLEKDLYDKTELSHLVKRHMTNEGLICFDKQLKKIKDLNSKKKNIENKKVLKVFTVNK